MNIKFGRKVWKEIILNNFRRDPCQYQILGLNCKINVGKEKITLINNKIGLEKSFNNAQVLETLINKYDDFKITGTVILLFGYYSFICNQKRYLFSEQIKDVKKITPNYQTLEFNAERLTRSTQLFNNALSSHLRNFQEQYRRAQEISAQEMSTRFVEELISFNDRLRRGR